VFEERVVPSLDPGERVGAAACFAEIVGGAVLCATTSQLEKVIEHEYIDAHAGADAWLIESSPSAALAFLEHPDPERRLAAIQVVARAGKDDATACDTIYQKVVGDPDSEVRVAALITYERLFLHTRDLQWLRRIAAIVLDDERPMFERFTAYCGLHAVWGDSFCDKLPQRRIDDEKLARLRESTFDAEWPVEVDWDFVRRCADGDGSSAG
jgi:hypothetical protein